MRGEGTHFAYRFSVAWTRVLPDGDGEVNGQGLDFYRRLVDGLAERGIEPCPTLYHWDLPQALQDKGGWASRDTIEAFARYAGIVAEALGDDVWRWITHNEPWVTAFLGHRDGIFAPGLKDWETALTVAHNILVSHGRAATAIRAADPDASVGIALDCRPSVASHPGAEEANRYYDGTRNRWFFDPVFGKGYPGDIVEEYVSAGRLPSGLEGIVAPGDMEVIATPIDFLGLNYYTTVSISEDSPESDQPEGPVGPGAQEGYTEMGWRNDPQGLTDFLTRIDTEYGPGSILVTENGASYSDPPDEDGKIADTRRIEYLDRHIDAVMAARDAGVPVDGYFVWSLMDNLEWVSGFSQRFGLIWVDKDTSQRILKDSYHWYRDRIASTET